MFLKLIISFPEMNNFVKYIGEMMHSVIYNANGVLKVLSSPTEKKSIILKHLFISPQNTNIFRSVWEILTLTIITTLQGTFSFCYSILCLFDCIVLNPANSLNVYRKKFTICVK